MVDAHWHAERIASSTPLHCNRPTALEACDATTGSGRFRGVGGVRTDLFAGIAWLGALAPGERERARRSLQLQCVDAKTLVCRQGEPAVTWLGVLDGLLRVSSVDQAGHETTIAGIRSGGWFGEGSVLKQEAYRYQVRALRKTQLAILPAEVFHALLEHSLGFNRFVMRQLNERLSQFIAARQIERVGVPEVRVARHLEALCNPMLYPGASTVMQIRQQELAALAGLSRQRVNQALSRLQDGGALRVEYGGVRILSLTALVSADACESPWTSARVPHRRGAETSRCSITADESHPLSPPAPLCGNPRRRASLVPWR